MEFPPEMKYIFSWYSQIIAKEIVAYVAISAVGTGIILLVIDASRGRRREVEHELLNLNRLEIDMINTIPLAFLNKRTWVFGATGKILCDIGMHILIIQWCKD